MRLFCRMSKFFIQGLIWLYIFFIGFVVESLEPGFLDFDNLPDTNFTCVGKVIGGYYADLETNCQMFHVCTIGQLDEPMDIRFLCLNGTVFDQETRVCERIDEVDCSKSEKFYSLNLELYGNTQPPILEESSEDDKEETQERPHKNPTKPPTTTTTTPTTLPQKTTHRQSYFTTLRPTTTINYNKEISTHHFPIKQNHDVRYDPEEINISLNPGTPPNLRTKPFKSFSDSVNNRKLAVTTHSSYDSEEEHVRNSNFHPIRKQDVVTTTTESIKSTSFKNINLPTPHHGNFHVNYHNNYPSGESNYHYQYQTNVANLRLPSISGHSYSNDQYRSSTHSNEYLPVTRKPFNLNPSSSSQRNFYLQPIRSPSNHYFTRTEKPQGEQLPVPQLPTLSPLLFSSPAPFTLTRHIENKRYTDDHQVSPPRIIISASASVSDASGRRLNYSLGTIGAAHILGQPPSSYDEYSEEDVVLDPFYHDVPKVNKHKRSDKNEPEENHGSQEEEIDSTEQKKRRKRSTEYSNEKVNQSKIIRSEKEAIDVLKFLFDWYKTQQRTTTPKHKITIPITPEVITEINEQLSANTPPYFEDYEDNHGIQTLDQGPSFDSEKEYFIKNNYSQNKNQDNLKHKQHSETKTNSFASQYLPELPFKNSDNVDVDFATHNITFEYPVATTPQQEEIKSRHDHLKYENTNFESDEENLRNHSELNEEQLPKYETRDEKHLHQENSDHLESNHDQIPEYERTYKEKLDTENERGHPESNHEQLQKYKESDKELLDLHKELEGNTESNYNQIKNTDKKEFNSDLYNKHLEDQTESNNDQLNYSKESNLNSNLNNERVDDSLSQIQSTLPKNPDYQDTYDYINDNYEPTTYTEINTESPATIQKEIEPNHHEENHQSLTNNRYDYNLEQTTKKLKFINNDVNSFSDLLKSLRSFRNHENDINNKNQFNVENQHDNNHQSKETYFDNSNFNQNIPVTFNLVPLNINEKYQEFTTTEENIPTTVQAKAEEENKETTLNIYHNLNDVKDNIYQTTTEIITELPTIPPTTSPSTPRSRRGRVRGRNYLSSNNQVEEYRLPKYEINQPKRSSRRRGYSRFQIPETFKLENSSQKEEINTQNKSTIIPNFSLTTSERTFTSRISNSLLKEYNPTTNTEINTQSTTPSINETKLTGNSFYITKSPEYRSSNEYNTEQNTEEIPQTTYSKEESFQTFLHDEANVPTLSFNNTENQNVFNIAQLDFITSNTDAETYTTTTESSTISTIIPEIPQETTIPPVTNKELDDLTEPMELTTITKFNNELEYTTKSTTTKQIYETDLKERTKFLNNMISKIEESTKSVVDQKSLTYEDPTETNPLSTTLPEITEITEEIIKSSIKDHNVNTSTTINVDITTLPEILEAKTEATSTVRSRSRRPSYQRSRSQNNSRRFSSRHRFSTGTSAKPEVTSVVNLSSIKIEDDVSTTDAPFFKSAHPTQAESSKKSSSSTTPLSMLYKMAIRKEKIKQFIFNCFGKPINKFYSDPRDCRLFHYCTQGYTSSQLLDMKFVCDLGTYFDDEKLICTKELPLRCK